MSFIRVLTVFVLSALIFTACAPGAGTGGAAPTRLVVYTGRSEPLIRPVIDAFTAKNPGIEVALKAGGNSELANTLLEERENPQADVFITTELFTIQVLAQNDVLQPYRAKGVENFPKGFIGADDTWTALTRRARVIMYNTDLLSPDEAPTSIFDLTDPKWKGKIAAAGSTNGSMQAQVAVMVELVGEPKTEAWLRGLIANDVTFFGSHTDARKAVGAGEFPLGLVNHYYYHLQKADGSPVDVVYPDQGEGQIGLITNATAAGIIKGAPNVAAAKVFLDFLVSPEGQAIFAEQNYEYPMLPGVKLREGVLPLDNLRLADLDVARAASETDATFALLEKVGLP